MFASLLMHGIVLQWLKPSPSASGLHGRPFIVEFAPPDRFNSGSALTKTAGNRPSTVSRKTTEAAVSTPDEKPAAPLDTTRLLKSAREFAIEEEQQAMRETSSRALTPVGMLEKELQQARTETRLANGMLKITTAAGTTYCLQPPPHFVQNTPAAALYNVPMTCP